MSCFVFNLVLLMFANVYCRVAFAEVPIEWIPRSKVGEVVSAIKAPTASDTDLESVAGPLFEKLLSSSRCYSDLKVTHVKEVDSNRDGTHGYKMYTLDLVGEDGERFTAFLDMQFQVKSEQCYHGGKIQHRSEIHAWLPIFYDEGSSNKLYNLKREVILRVSRN